MSEAEQKQEVVPPHEPAYVRRFELPDLSQHGSWLLRRFQTVFPDADEHRIAGYLRGLIFDNEHMFLYQPHAVALAQLVHTGGIRMKKLVQERFVWVKDRDDKAQLEAAADFYLHMHQWAKRQEAERLIVCENTDVPKALIEKTLGQRIFETKISHVRL